MPTRLELTELALLCADEFDDDEDDDDNDELRKELSPF
jgi:hypothetical protein